MKAPILQTKLFVPQPCSELVRRPHLIEWLNRGLCSGHKLTLVSAPAGFGKSALLSEWVRGLSEMTQQVAWISLDDADNDVARFLAYLVEALPGIDSGIRASIQAALSTRQLPNIENLLIVLSNEIAATQADLILVLDDYHAITTSAIHETISFFLDHQPPHLHMVIASRDDPFLPLSRLRARGQLTEVREADLRFSRPETTAFLNQVMGLALSGENVAALESRTEGWVAGLQLAALAIQSFSPGQVPNTPDITWFIATFAGDDRYIADYLVDEVLAHQDRETNAFLLQTSVLDRLSASLCNAVTGIEDSQTMLEKLDRSNLFILPLDNRRQWYRYHRLFAELLRHHLSLTHPQQLDDLHRRASIWFEENGYVQDAVKHALADTDGSRAADLIEGTAMALLGRSQTKILLDWFDALPSDVMETRPMLCVYEAWALVLDEPASARGRVERLVLQAERELETSGADLQLRNLVAGHAASIRTFLLQPPVQPDHDPHAVLALLRESQELLPPSERGVRSINAINMGYEYSVLGDAGEALAGFAEALSLARESGNDFVTVFSVCGHALIANYLGRLDEAIRLCREEIKSFDSQLGGNNQLVPAVGGLHIALGWFLLERYELSDAESSLTKGLELLQWIGEYEMLALGHIALVRLRVLQGDANGALRIAERLVENWPACASLAETLRAQIQLSELPDTGLHQIAAVQAELERWAQAHRPERSEPSRDVCVDDAKMPGINPWGETQHLEHLTWVRVQTAKARAHLTASTRADLKSVLLFLERRLHVAERRGLVFRVIELCVAQALVLDAQGNGEDAVIALQRALTLAEPERYNRVFIDNGAPMTLLLLRLRSTAKGGSSSDFVAQLLDNAQSSKSKSAADPPIKPTTRLIEPLSERELQVLRLLNSELSGPDIARALNLLKHPAHPHQEHIWQA